MGYDPPQRRQRTIISFRDVMISGPFSQSEDGELQIEGVLEGDLTCHALIVPPGGTVKGTIRADWVVIQGNFCGNVETSVFTATKDAVVIGGRITVYEKVLIEPDCLFRGELQRPGEGDATPARGFARSAAAEESDRLATQTMASWSFAEGDSVLVEAIGKGDNKIVGRLLLAGADPNAAAPQGMTALTLATANLRVEAAELLLRAGADPDLRNAEGETPLMLANKRGAQSLVETLLAGGADPSAARADGTTPLIEAARRGRTEIVRALLRAGADLEERNAAGEMPMLLAKERGYQETFALLRQAAVGDLDPKPEDAGGAASGEPAEREQDATASTAEPAVTDAPEEPGAEAAAKPEPAAAPAEPAQPSLGKPASEPEAGVSGPEPRPVMEAPAEADTVEADPPPDEVGPEAAASPEATEAPGPSTAEAGAAPAPQAEIPPEATIAAAGDDPGPGKEPAPEPRPAPPARRPAARSPILRPPRESAESVLADLAPAPTPAADREAEAAADDPVTPEAPLPADVPPPLEVPSEPDILAESLAPAEPQAPPETEAPPALEAPPRPETRPEAVGQPVLEAERPTILPSGAPEPVLVVPGRSGAPGETPPPDLDEPPVASTPEPAPLDPAPQAVGPEARPEAGEAPPQAEPYLSIPAPAQDVEPAPAQEPEAPPRPESQVLAPEEVEDLSRQVLRLIEPFSLDEARAALPACEAESNGWRLATQGDGLTASAIRPDPASPGGREAVLVKYGAGGAPPAQIELRRRGSNGAGGPEEPEVAGDLLVSLFEPDESLVYWPLGFRRVVLRSGDHAGSYACDEDGNWSRSDDSAGR